MTIEEFRASINSGPTAEELKEGFEKRITTLVNDTLDNRDDLKEMKSKISEFEQTLKRIQSTLNSLTGNVPPKPE